ncbi:MAG: tetratricopeptide repeat protein [Elusimicrobiota bacterium]
MIKKHVFPLLLIIALCFIVLSPSLNNKFTNFDDDLLITENMAIRTCSFNTIKYIFTNPINFEYRPITYILYTVQYKFFGLNPRGYHAVSLILHLLNTALIFIFAMVLTKHYFIAIFTSIIFGIHPLQVQSVAWIAGQDDLVYTTFYLLTLIYYSTQKRVGNRIYHLFCYTLFSLALLSKPLAVTIPFALVLIDFYSEGKLAVKQLINKIPFIIIALAWAGFTINILNNSYLTQDFVNIYKRIMDLILTAYELCLYSLKIILPVKLACVYPTPSASSLPVVLSVIIFPLIVYTLYRIAKKDRLIIFGTLFAGITILPVLHFFVNHAMSDHRVYLPMLGISLIISKLLINLQGFLNKSVYNHLGTVTVITFCVLITTTSSFLSNSRTKVWFNSYSLWNTTLKDYPGYALALTFRGYAYYYDGQYDKALRDYNESLSIMVHTRTLMDRGAVYYAIGEYEAAIADFSLSINSSMYKFKALLLRGNTYYKMKKYQNAIDDYTETIKLNPSYGPAYLNRATVYSETGNKDLATADFLQARILGYTNTQK